jgi:hypothetical protein
MRELNFLLNVRVYSILFLLLLSKKVKILFFLPLFSSLKFHLFSDLGDPTRAYLPGWHDQPVVDSWPLDGYHYLHPLVRRNSSMDRPDLKDPVFSSCHVPLIWLPAWLFAYAEFFSNSFAPLWLMQVEKKLFDDKIDLVPLFAGLIAPNYVETLLRPYTTGKVSR